MRENHGSVDFVKVLTDIPRGDESPQYMSKRDEYLAEFIGHAIVPTYGYHRIKSWCAANKGKRFLSYMSMTCLAYGLALLLDKHEYWGEVVAIEESLKTPEERAQYRQFKKNKKQVNEDLRTRFAVEAKNRFTIKKGKEVGLGRHGFSNEGVKYYKDHARYLFALDEVRCCGICSSWDCWTEANGFYYEVIPKKMEDDGIEEDVGEHDADTDELILEGDEGDDEFSGWAVAAEKIGRSKSLEEVDDSDEEEENGNGMVQATEVLGTLNPVTPNEKNRSKRDSSALSYQGKSDDGSESNSSEDSQDGGFLFK